MGSSRCKDNLAVQRVTLGIPLSEKRFLSSALYHKDMHTYSEVAAKLLVGETPHSDTCVQSISMLITQPDRILGELRDFLLKKAM